MAYHHAILQKIEKYVTNKLTEEEIGLGKLQSDVEIYENRIEPHYRRGPAGIFTRRASRLCARLDKG
jgi:hypothetical protein